MRVHKPTPAASTKLFILPLKSMQDLKPLDLLRPYDAEE